MQPGKLKSHQHFDIDHIFEKIPQQGPLEFFVHHNTLHHYENMNFFDAVKKAASEYGANAFMPEEFYIQKFQRGLIKDDMLRQEITRLMDHHLLQLPPDLIWRLLTDRSKKTNSEIRNKISDLQNEYFRTESVYYSEIIKDDYGIDSDFHVNRTLYHYLSSYFDFGSANWALEHREKGLWHHFCELHTTKGLFVNKYRKTLSNQLKQVRASDPHAAVQYFLQSLNVNEKSIEGFLFSLCLKHKGWAGFVKSLVEHPEYIHNDSIKPSLIEFLAIILACETAAILTFSEGPISVPREKRIPMHSEQFLARYIHTYNQYPMHQAALNTALPFLTEFNRQEIFHRAYESTLYQKFINAYSGCKKRKTINPRYQAILCMDDREESMRRYLEMDPSCETFGSAGHFGLNISFKGLFEPRYRALCPVNVHPDYKISERLKASNPIKLKTIHLANTLKRYGRKASKGILSGYLVSIFSSTLRLVPFIIDVIDPRINLGLRKKAQGFLHSAVTTELVYKKEEGAQEGIDRERREHFAESFLTLIGLKKNFAPYVFIMGHGSMSLNNPHRAAYDCGACGGGIGAVNARLMAKILNEPEIRLALSKRDIVIPESTQFIGAYHNTCSDEIDFFDLPNDTAVDDLLLTIKRAGVLDSQERSRRFKNIPLKHKPEFYFKAVQARAHDIRQPRAEYGHSTNALFIIGDRSYTHDLFLDRRAFLLSYDYEQDNDLTTLNQLLTATIPVISGINLEYFFSYVDNEFYGAGTKLPHNVNGLIGVMNGHSSDLRPGLPWQMVEIHQPIRLFLLVVADLDKVRTLLSQENPYNQIIENEWIRFAVHDIQSNTLWVYNNHQFEQAQGIGTAPDYFPQDEKILSIRNHLEFGHINYGN